jgi:hypothetical protein
VNKQVGGCVPTPTVLAARRGARYQSSLPLSRDGLAALGNWQMTSSRSMLLTRPVTGGWARVDQTRKITGCPRHTVIRAERTKRTRRASEHPTSRSSHRSSIFLTSRLPVKTKSKHLRGVHGLTVCAVRGQRWAV